MIILVFVIISLLSLSCLGGALYVLYERKRAINKLEKELEAAEKCLQDAQKIVSDREKIINQAVHEADLEQERQKRIISEARQEMALENQRKLALAEDCTKLEEKKTELQNQLHSIQEEFYPYELNFYEPHYHLDKALEYEMALNSNRKEQVALVKSGDAIDIYYSELADKKLYSVLGKLLIRTFNSECDLLLQNVDYKNVVVYQNRIENSFNQLNKLVMKYGVALSQIFLLLKLDELHIYHEFQEKKQREAEEQKRIREIMREEIRAEREMEKAKAEAEKEEHRYQLLLDRMLEAARQAHGAELEKMNAQIAVLQQQLEEAKAKERAISQAQLTKAGYVYVISNIGSFGENVFKIGMTRRLEPQERIDELGDASVPFQFDVHAMIYHENAPELENILHRAFEKNRVNKVNSRKEFFRVSLDEIERIAHEHRADITFTQVAEAVEYRKTLAMEKAASA